MTVPISQEKQAELPKEKYTNVSYNKKERFINYWNQLTEVLRFKPRSVLEIGVGSKTVYDLLKKSISDVKGLDINKELDPDIVGSVESIPLQDESVDVVLSAEVLEHLPFSSFGKSLSELYRVTKVGAVISLPHRGASFSITMKVPIIPWIRGVWKIPYFWKIVPLSPEHFWEVGLKGYPLGKIKKEIKKTGFKIRNTFIDPLDLYHLFVILEK